MKCQGISYVYWKLWNWFFRILNWIPKITFPLLRVSLSLHPKAYMLKLCIEKKRVEKKRIHLIFFCILWMKLQGYKPISTKEKEILYKTITAKEKERNKKMHKISPTIFSRTSPLIFPIIFLIISRTIAPVISTLPLKLEKKY